MRLKKVVVLASVRGNDIRWCQMTDAEFFKLNSSILEILQINHPIPVFFGGFLPIPVECQSIRQLVVFINSTGIVNVRDT